MNLFVIPHLMRNPEKCNPRRIMFILWQVKETALYILWAGRSRKLRLIGVTSNLKKRVYEHKSNAIEGFTKKYGVHILVYYEQTPDVISAIEREKRIKKWKRKWKLEIIEKLNPNWKDLYDLI